MGKTDIVNTKLKPFTKDDLSDRDLVISMLKKEDTIINDEDVGQAIYRNKYNESLYTLEPQLIIQRIVLKHFGFNTSDENVQMYREIFRTYYKSPTDYDKEVLNSVTYMRSNRCVYYTSPKINVGDTIENVNLLALDGKTKMNLHSDILKQPYELALLCAFSTS